MKRWSQPNPARLQQAVNNYHIPGAGQTVTWRHYISASAGVSEAGFGDVPAYRDSVITAFPGQFFPPNIRQHQTPAGAIPAGAFGMVSREQLAANDEIVWCGNTYRVEGEPVRLSITQNWFVELKRAT